MHKFAFIIPCYQHSGTLDKVLKGLEPFNRPIIVVNDGSDSPHRHEMEKVCAARENVQLIHHVENQGKGGAVMTGLRAAFDQGLTHAIQIDSDGQHDLGKVDELMALSHQYPQDLISGQPQYDESVPKSRLYGRYATHIWVWIETLSFDLKDSMCGFRVYPLKSTIEVLNNNNLGKRMDFDTEIMVRLYWAGVNCQFLKVPVIYPENGISHFDVWKDNVKISKMHTKLFFSMLPRIPSLLNRKKKNEAWYNIEETGTRLGIRILLLFYKITGRRVLNWVLYPVAVYYSLFSSKAKAVSLDYQKRIQKMSGKKFSTLQHIYTFASAALDKFAVWFGDIKYSDLVKEDVDALIALTQNPTGVFFITSHYGNIEVCRSLGRFSGVKFNALVYYENAKRFNSFLSEINPESNLDLISVKDAGPDLAIALKEKLEKKEWIFIMGDRQSIQNNNRTLPVIFLGAAADIPEGPFMMAYIMDAPIYAIHCFRQGSRFRIQLKPLEIKLERGRNNRQSIVQDLANQYIQELEQIVLKDPLQWYNFFSFWSNKA